MRRHRRIDRRSNYFGCERDTVIEGRRTIKGAFFEVSDGAGHLSPHYVVAQSWRCFSGTSSTERAATPFPDVPEDTDVAVESPDAPPEVLLRRLDLPEARTSAEDFTSWYAGLSNANDELDQMTADLEREDHSVGRENARVMEWINEKRPAWPFDLKHLTLGVLALYRCRLSDVFMLEYV